ncbi:hypothetical protein J4437_05645 [Candidatus Woesearchaeota archaeon]|nr:hypothetical protein [Candidatus Woesearchaeota archaeon]
MTNQWAEIFAELKDKLHEQKRTERQMLESIAEQVFDAYRAALKDDFTTQGVIAASTYGCDIRDWNSIDSKMQDVFWALGAKYPESVDTKKASNLFSDGVVGHLREKGLTISDEQAKLFPDLMESVMQESEKLGFNYDNKVRQARLLGLKPLVDYRSWLIKGGQTFMDYGTYSFELKQTNNTIKAAQNALITALVAAEDIVADYGMRVETIVGIKKVDLKDDAWLGGIPFLVTYETKDGATGKIDVLNSSLRSITEEIAEHRAFSLLHEKKINPEYNTEVIGPVNMEALVGLPGSISEELRANVWRRNLNRFGVDPSQKAEVVLVDPTDREKVIFFYGTQINSKDNGIMVGFKFDERYNRERYAFVMPREIMQNDIGRAERIKDRLDHSFKPLLDPMSVQDYVKNKQRLTQYRP